MEKADSHPPELLDVEASVDMTCYLLSVFFCNLQGHEISLHGTPSPGQ